MYSNKLAVAIKANGKVLREFEDQIYLPYQTEYSIFIRNKNSVRASVKIEIDGIDVTQGVSLIVNPNDEIELERFIKNGNLNQGNRFKFIQRTLAIEKHRGIRVDDGLVRVEFQFEKLQNITTTITTTTNTDSRQWTYQQVDPWKRDPWYPPSPYTPYTPYTPFCGINSLKSNNTQFTKSNNTQFTNSVGAYTSNNDVGITAPGSISDQEFNHVSNFNLESQKHVIILRLIGEHLGKSVSNAVTTRSRTSCSTCGHISKSTSARFCSHCGASLQIIY